MKRKICKYPKRKICKHYQLFGGGFCNLVSADMMCSKKDMEEETCIWFEKGNYKKMMEEIKPNKEVK